MSDTDLTAKKCKPCEGGTKPFDTTDINSYLAMLTGWARAGESIEKTFGFKNYYETMAFVNSVAWISHREDHHPDMEVSYKNCKVRYSTHSIKGLSENDFICAARVDAL